MAKCAERVEQRVVLGDSAGRQPLKVHPVERDGAVRRGLAQESCPLATAQRPAPRHAIALAHELVDLPLGITLYTVKDHVKALLAKTGCASRAELAACFIGK